MDKAILDEANDMMMRLGNSADSWLLYFRMRRYQESGSATERRRLACRIARMKKTLQDAES